MNGLVHLSTSHYLNQCWPSYRTPWHIVSLLGHNELTHWGRVMHIYVSVSWTIIGSDNGLLPVWHQAIVWTNSGLLPIRPQGTYVNEISIKIHTFSFNKMHFQVSAAKWRPFCLGPNVLTPPLWHSSTIWWHRCCILVNIVSDNGLLPEGIIPLPEQSGRSPKVVALFCYKH